MDAQRPPRPLGALLITSACIVVAEALIMVIITRVPGLPRWTETLLDASVLLVLVSPALYVLIYRPQLRYLSELRRAAGALEAANSGLEGRVSERTQELRSTNARLDETISRLQAQNSRITDIAEMVDVFQACHTTEEAYAIIGRYTQRLFPHTSGALYVFRESRNHLESAAKWGESRANPEAFDPGECWALRRARPHVLSGLDSTTLCRHVGGQGPKASICVPLMAQGDTLGVLTLLPDEASPAPPDGGSDLAERASLAVSVGENISLALANLKLRETLRHQAIRDPLTGLFNRRYLEETLRREVRRAERRGSPLGIATLDIDHFKRFNDTFGHEAGDVLLRELGNLLKSCVRTEDIACRLGGEEFLLVMPDAPLEICRRRMEEVREASKRLTVSFHGEPLGVVTISVGVAALPEHGASPEELMRAADQALYQAKHQGRDRVMLAARPASADTPLSSAHGVG